MRLLVLTLASGESALPTLQAQLGRQTLKADHHVIEGLPNREAHAALYDTIARRASDYALFFKLDADMTLRRDTALAEMVAFAAAHPQVRHFLFPVYDHFSAQDIRGVSLYRSGVRWAPSDDGLFVDPSPIDAPPVWCGGSALPFVNHGEIVSDFECFSFGVHKLIKVLQRDRREKKRSKQAGRLLDLARVRHLCRHDGAARHWQVMRGVAWALRHRDYRVMDSKAGLRRAFDALGAHAAEQDAALRRLVFSDVAWLRALVAELGVLATMRALLRQPPALERPALRFDLA